MNWPWRRETRSSGFSDLVIAGLVARAGESAASDLLGSIETAAGLWERAFTSGRSTMLPPCLLGLMGRSLLLTGSAVLWRSRGSGLLPVSQWTVRGRSAAQSRWNYELTLAGPDATITKKATAAQVVHVRICSDPARPWEGNSPILRSRATRDALQEIEKSLKDEHAGPLGRLLPVPDPEDASLKDALLKLQGKALLVEQSELGLAGEGQAARVRWTPKRIGPEPNEATLTARDSLERSLLMAAGIPPAMVSPSSTANASREALRQFLWLTVSPVVGLVSAELERLGLDPKIDLSQLNASDLAGRARALKGLIESGLPKADARRLTGLL